MRIDQVLTLTRPMVGVDTETTGTVVRRARIVQLALEIYVPGRLVHEYKTLVNPRVPIPAGASAVHGITDDIVKDAPTFRDLAKDLYGALTECDFCGKNAKRFDLPLLREEFARAGYIWDYETASIIEVERLWQLAEPRKLENAVDKWGTNADHQELGDLDAHDALQDVRWSTRVAANMAQHLGMFGWTPDRVHAQLFAEDYDADGKLRWNESGELAMTFGDHRDIPLSSVEPGFLRWMLKKDFSPKVKAAVQAALNGTPLRK